MSTFSPRTALSQPSFASPSRNNADYKFHPSKATPDRSQHPSSPPTSGTASNFNASSPSSPQSAVFTPASAPSMSAQTSQQGFTPASYASGRDAENKIVGLYGDEDATMHDILPEETPRISSKRKLTDDESTLEPSKRRRTDHDRNSAVQGIADPCGTLPTMSPLYKLSNTPYSVSRPHITDDLFSLYSLTSIASSVARNDPVTGEKINQLKKSYKGKVKDLAGKNNAVSNPGDLRSLLDWPDEEWHVQRVMGKELLRRDAAGNEIAGFDPAEALLAKLSNAVKMQPGKLPGPENEKWHAILAQDDAPLAKTVGAVKLGKGGLLPITTTAAMLPTVQNSNIQSNTTAAQSPRSSKRQVAKRRYDDGSYEGYEEEWGDADEVGSVGGHDDGRSVKKRKTKVGNCALDSRDTNPRYCDANSGLDNLCSGSGVETGGTSLGTSTASPKKLMIRLNLSERQQKLKKRRDLKKLQDLEMQKRKPRKKQRHRKRPKSSREEQSFEESKGLRRIRSIQEAGHETELQFKTVKRESGEINNLIVGTTSQADGQTLTVHEKFQRDDLGDEYEDKREDEGIDHHGALFKLLDGLKRATVTSTSSGLRSYA